MDNLHRVAHEADSDGIVYTRVDETEPVSLAGRQLDAVVCALGRVRVVDILAAEENVLAVWRAGDLGCSSEVVGRVMIVVVDDVYKLSAALDGQHPLE